MQSLTNFFIGTAYALVAVAFVLGVMILVHEFGHYAVAKLCGVRVDVFSLGFGKRLFGFRRGDTDYRISALPLGGYVKMAGENPMEARTGDPSEFMSHPRWQRLLIAIAGPAMNILLAIGIVTGVFMVHYSHDWYLDQPTRVGWVDENSPAAKAGLKPGDLITQIDGLTNPLWEDTKAKIAISPGQPVDLVVKRGDQIINATLVPDTYGPSRVGEAGVEPAAGITVEALEASMPAQKAGIRKGDEILAINGIGLHSIGELTHFLQDDKGKPVEITVMRDGKVAKYAMTPVLAPNAEGVERYRIGFSPGVPQHVDRLKFTQALTRSIEQNKKYALLLVELVQKMVERKVSVKMMSGPIDIAKVSGEAAREPGWTPLLLLMAGISLNLGIFNLFPIPILDGGVILLLLIEGLMRRDISLRIKERIYQAAFVFLVLFAAMVIFNDITKTLPGLSKLLP
ncbi:MAG TPA: RIP metalloprotease RseP [Terriglobales bacterium]|jgi:regulator of sigma E protease|nr:RIP metalloprotease RseP [Terriglobales bacterium]